MRRILVNMNRTVLGSFIGLLLGAAAGGVAGYFYSKNKYLAMAEKEIESVKKVYEKHFSNPPIINSEEQVDTTPKINKPIPAPLVDPDKETYQNYAGMYSGNGDKPKVGSVKTTIKTI